MAKKLTEDQINWILSVDASEAQQEIRKLVKTNRELVNVNKERRQELIKLEAQGKKETEEYRNLESEIKKTSQAISTNNKLVGELEKKLDITGLTMSQLKKKARDLQRQLDQTVQSANPEEYQALQNELDRVRGRMDELRAAGRHVQNEMSYAEKAISKVTVAMKLFVAVQLWQYLKNIATQAYNTRKEFATYEAVLKNATGSTKTAASAMKMIQTLAADTPASVAEWTQAYIKLINRGITPTKDELIRMGDIASSQGKDVDQFIEALLDAMTGENERLKEFGITAKKNGETTAFTFRGVTTEVQNTDQAIKDYILSLGNLQGVQGAMAAQMQELAGLESNLGDQMDAIYNKIGKKLEPAIKSFMGKLGSLMGKLSQDLDSANDKFQIQQDKTMALVLNTPKLISKYEELRTKTNLSKVEQEELSSIMQKIAGLIPVAVTQWDEYGNAIAISTDKVNEYIRVQKNLYSARHKEAIEEEKDNLKDLQKKYDDLLLQQSKGGRRERKGMLMKYTVYDPEEMDSLTKEIKEVGEKISQSEQRIADLGGQTLQKMVLEQQQASENMIKQKETFNAMNKETLAAWIADERNAASEYMKIAKQIYDSKFPEKKGKDGKDEENEKAVKAALEQQKQLYQQQQIELKQRYIAGNDEQLQTQTQFNKAMEELALKDLNARLAIFGLEKEQRQQLEQQILDIRIKAMEDFHKKKAELESQQTSLKRQSDQEAMAENDEWMSQQMKKLQQEHQQRTEIIQQSLQSQVESYKGYGSQIGNALGQVLSGQENMLAAFGNTMVDILFDVLSQIVNQKIAEATAVAVAEQAKAAAISAAQPDSVLTFGASAAARTAVIGGLIMAGLTAAKTALKGLLTKKSKADAVTSGSSGSTYYTRVPGKASGGYIDVTRAQDGRRYKASLNPSMRGFVSRPTVIVGEGPAGMSREWVASNDAVNNPTVAPILNILDAAQQAGTIRSLDLNKYIQARTLVGKAEGGSISPSVSPEQTAAYKVSSEIETRLLKILESIDRNGIHAYTLLDEFESKQKLRDKSRKIGSK